MGGCGDWTQLTEDTMTCKFPRKYLNPMMNFFNPLQQDQVNKLWFDYRMEYYSLPSSLFDREDDEWIMDLANAADTMGGVDLGDSSDMND